jgi:nucleotidyltransferase substrate binding protein (TIGR01987 family)
MRFLGVFGPEAPIIQGMPNPERFDQRRNYFRQALKRLREALARPEDDFIRDACIQRFEFTYEAAWKAMKLWLEAKDIDVRNAKDALRESLAQGLIQDPNAWSSLHEARNLTSHTYRAELAKQVYATLREQAIPLFEALDKALERP